MADLKINYVDDVLDATKNQLRKYQQIQNDDGTVSFVDVTEYTQVGTSFGAKDINDTNAAINDVNGKLASKLAYVDFQLINGTGYTDIPMPTGFTYNNCISISLLVLYNGNIYFEDDISSFYVTIQNGKYQVYNSNDIFYGCTVGVAFMRTDI